ncbi:MAG: hypothetical protein PVG66_14835 [Chromatiales bacterium]|jgi:hypothetical protein
MEMAPEWLNRRYYLASSQPPPENHMPEQRQPGISRSQRVSEEGLQRLERQLTSGARLAPEILAQWVKRYGKPAQELIEQYQPNEASDKHTR